MEKFGVRDNKAISIEDQIKKILKRTGEENEKADSIAWELLRFYLSEISYDTLFYKNEQFFFSNYPSNDRKLKKGIKSREIIKIYDALNQLKIKIAENIFQLEEWFKSKLKVEIGSMLAINGELEFTIKDKFIGNQIVFEDKVKVSLQEFDEETIKRFATNYDTLWQLIDALTLNGFCGLIKSNLKE